MQTLLTRGYVAAMLIAIIVAYGLSDVNFVVGKLEVGNNNVTALFTLLLGFIMLLLIVISFEETPAPTMRGYERQPSPSAKYSSSNREKPVSNI